MTENVEKRTPKRIDELPTLREFCKTIDKDVHQLYLRERLGGRLVDRLSVEMAVHYYGMCRVFNYYKREPQILDVFIKTHRPPRYPEDAFTEAEPILDDVVETED